MYWTISGLLQGNEASFISKLTNPIGTVRTVYHLTDYFYI